MVKSLPAHAGDIKGTGSIPGLGFPGGGHGNPLQYSWLENPVDRGAWSQRDMAEAMHHGMDEESGLHVPNEVEGLFRISLGVSWCLHTY